MNPTEHVPVFALYGLVAPPFDPLADAQRTKLAFHKQWGFSKGYTSWWEPLVTSDMAIPVGAVASHLQTTFETSCLVYFDFKQAQLYRVPVGQLPVVLTYHTGTFPIYLFTDDMAQCLVLSDTSQRTIFHMPSKQVS
jgi:hypothetical protein